MNKLMNDISSKLIESNLIGVTLSDGINENFFYLRKNGNLLSLLYNVNEKEFTVVKVSPKSLKSEIEKTINFLNISLDKMEYTLTLL